MTFFSCIILFKKSAILAKVVWSAFFFFDYLIMESQDC